MPDPLPLAESDRIAVIGLGYVGLPLAVALAGHGKVQVTGFDIDPTRIADLKRGHDRTGEVRASDLQALGNLSLGSDSALLADQGIYIVTVPTPVDEEKNPDLTPLLGRLAQSNRSRDFH